MSNTLKKEYLCIRDFMSVADINAIDKLAIKPYIVRRVPRKKARGGMDYYYTTNMQVRLMCLEGVEECIEHTKRLYLTKKWYNLKQTYLRMLDIKKQFLKVLDDAHNGKDIFIYYTKE